jgi:hypothetical protein
VDTQKAGYLVCLIVAALFGGNQATEADHSTSADYAIAVETEAYMVVPDSWKLTRDNSGQISRFECSYKGTKHNWPIDRFLLAARLDSNSICAGTWKKLTDSYLIAIDKLSHADEIAAEVVSHVKGGPLQVAGIWNFGEPPKYERYFARWSVPPLARKARDPVFRQKQFNEIGNR